MNGLTLGLLLVIGNGALCLLLPRLIFRSGRWFAAQAVVAPQPAATFTTGLDLALEDLALEPAAIAEP